MTRKSTVSDVLNLAGILVVPAVRLVVVPAERRLVRMRRFETQRPISTRGIAAIDRTGEKPHHGVSPQEAEEWSRLDGLEQCDALGAGESRAIRKARKHFGALCVDRSHALAISRLVLPIEGGKREVDEMDHARFLSSRRLCGRNNFRGECFEILGS